MKNTALTLIVLLLIAVGAYYLYANNRTEVDEVVTDEMTAIEESMEDITADSVTIQLAAIDPAVVEQSGEAVITSTETGVRVALTLNAVDETTLQPAHIHVGECPGVGAVAYNLEAVVNGMSTTDLDVTMEELEGMLPLAINIHKSEAESSVYTACGDIVL